MSQKVQLPPGCVGFTAADGSRPTGKAGGSVELTDRQAKDLAKSEYAEKGLVTLSPGTVVGTKGGRVCQPCGGRRWQAWSLHCPRCGGPTEKE